MHQSVVEMGTDVCFDINDARKQVTRLRRDLSNLAKKHELRIAAAGTHPFSHWKDQKITVHPRYKNIVSDMQQVARANLIFGLHVHVGVNDREVAIQIMNAARYFYLTFLLYQPTPLSGSEEIRDSNLTGAKCLIDSHVPEFQITSAVFQSMITT